MSELTDTERETQVADAEARIEFLEREIEHLRERCDVHLENWMHLRADRDDVAATVLREEADQIESVARTAPNRSLWPGAEWAAACLRNRADSLDAARSEQEGYPDGLSGGC